MKILIFISIVPIINSIFTFEDISASLIDVQVNIPRVIAIADPDLPPSVGDFLIQVSINNEPLKAKWIISTPVPFSPVANRTTFDPHLVFSTNLDSREHIIPVSISYFGFTT